VHKNEVDEDVDDSDDDDEEEEDEEEVDEPTRMIEGNSSNCGAIYLPEKNKVSPVTKVNNNNKDF